MLKRLVLTIMFLAALPLFASSSMPMPQSQSQSQAQADPKQMAVRAYNDGLKYRDRAWNAEKELATATDAKRKSTLEEIIKKSYNADIRAQRDAIKSDEGMYQAHAELGYALRKTGDYQNALASYDTALKLMPNYGEAIEYRAEAYLGLNRVNDAKDAYLLLYNGGAQNQAKQLADAMQKWLAARKTEPAGVDQAAIDDFAKWISQRSEIAKSTASASSGGSWQ